MIKIRWTIKTAIWGFMFMLQTLFAESVLAQRAVPRSAIAPVKQSRGQQSHNEGIVSFSIMDTKGNTVKNVLFNARREQDEPSSATSKLRLLKNGGVISLPEGSWIVSVLPNRDYPYSGDVEVEVEAEKLMSILLQVERVRTSQLNINVVSDTGRPLKAYVSSLPVNLPSFALQGVTDTNGTISLPIPTAESVILTADIVGGNAYQSHKQKVEVNNSVKSLDIVLQRKVVSAVCTGYFSEAGESREIVMTGGSSYIVFSRRDEYDQEMKAYAYDGKFWFYALDPGEYVIKTVSCRLPFPKNSGRDGFYRTHFAPTTEVRFLVDGSKNIKQIGAVAFDEWPAEPGIIRGSVSGLKGNKDGFQITGFRVDSDGNRLGQKAYGMTDVRGRFALQGLVSGLYDIEVSKGPKIVGQVHQVVALPISTALVSIHCSIE